MLFTRSRRYKTIQVTVVIVTITATAMPIPIPAQAPLDNPAFPSTTVLLLVPLQVRLAIMPSSFSACSLKQSKSFHGSTVTDPEVTFKLGKMFRLADLRLCKSQLYSYEEWERHY